MGHVHERCLQEWVQAHAETSEVHGFPACPTCKERYRGDVVLLLAASSALRLSLDLPPSAESRLVTELQQRRMTREAAALLRRRMRWNVLVADETHPETLQGICNVASAMCEVRQWDAAAVLLRRVLKCCDRLLGTRSIWRSSWRWQLPVVAGGDGAWGDEIDRDELEILRYERCCVHTIAQDAAEALVEVLRKLGRHEEAQAQLRRKKALSRSAWLGGALLLGARGSAALTGALGELLLVLVACCSLRSIGVPLVIVVILSGLLCLRAQWAPVAPADDFPSWRLLCTYLPFMRPRPPPWPRDDR